MKCFDILVLRAVIGPNFKENGQFLAILGFCSLFFQENIFFQPRAQIAQYLCEKFLDFGENSFRCFLNSCFHV